MQSGELMIDGGESEPISEQPLSQRLRPGCPLPLEETAQIVAQLCLILQQAHDQGITHQDLRAENLILEDDPPTGKLKLTVLNFGPISATGSSTEPFRDDLYAIGLMLFEMLTGYPSPQPLASFAAVNPNLPPLPALERLTLRGLSENPCDRPQSPRQLAESFIEALRSDTATGSTTQLRAFAWREHIPASLSSQSGQGHWSGPALWAIVSGASSIAAALALGFAAWAWFFVDRSGGQAGETIKAVPSAPSRPRLSGGRSYPISPGAAETKSSGGNRHDDDHDRNDAQPKS